MRLTLRIDDELCCRAKAEAAERGISLTKLVEEAIRERLDRSALSVLRRHLNDNSGAGSYTEERRDLLPDWDAATLLQKVNELQKPRQPDD